MKSLAKGSIGLMVFALLMTPLLLSLGFWQLDRAEEKQQLIDKQSHGETEQFIELAEVRLGDQENDWSYRTVSVSGHYRANEYLLLDNRTRDGRVGYEVISLFKTDEGKVLLVNRGWVKAPSHRDELPTITSDLIETLVNIKITGAIYFPSNQVFTLSDEHIPQGWPKRIQKLDIDALSKALGQGEDIYPFTVRLSDNSQPGALQTGWKISTMSPDKHFGYAVQWFSLALVLVVMTALAIRKMGENKTDDS